MKRIVTRGEMKALDAFAIEKMGVPSMVLMERAALCTVQEMEKHLSSDARILVVCGSGNNGGDGIAIARLLFLKGYAVEWCPVGNPDHMTEETLLQKKIAENYHVPVTNNPNWDEYTTIVDAIFGVGLSRRIEGKYARVIERINEAPAFRVAVDLPSGIDGDTGEILGVAVQADLTITFAFLKRGLVFYPGRMYSGEISVADIGIYSTSEVPTSAMSAERGDLALLPKRVPWGNKGTFGKVLVVAGSRGMCGAAYLSAYAALAAGAGMVKVQTVEENRVPLQTLAPEIMVTCSFDEETNRRNLDWCDVLVIGPGLGTSDESKDRASWFLAGALDQRKNVVLDADGLNLLALHPEWREFLDDHVILTPHVGEMARLMGSSAAEIKADPTANALRLAEETGTICVLKDACTVVADASGSLYLNRYGNPGMATAGSGDVLSGMTAAVCCMFLESEKEKKLSRIRQAALAVLLHSLCGDYATKEKSEKSMTAKDIIQAVSEIYKEAETQENKNGKI